MSGRLRPPTAERPPPMPFPHLQNPLRLILWFTAFGAALGVVYSRSIAMSEGSPLFSFDGVLRGLLTGTVISSILISFETFVLAGPIGRRFNGRPLRCTWRSSRSSISW